MTIEEFQEHINRYRNPELTEGESLANAAMGLAGEAGELVDLCKKNLFHDVPAKWDAVVGELGDVLHYLCWVASLYNATMDQVIDHNVEKLAKRYPDGFVKGGGIR